MYSFYVFLGYRFNYIVQHINIVYEQLSSMSRNRFDI